MSPEVTVVNRPESERYEIIVDGVRAGLLTYRLTPSVITFLHAEIDPAIEGRGLGTRLAGGALDDARSRALTVVARCPFVADFIRRNPAYADLLASGAAAPHARRDGPPHTRGRRDGSE